MSDFHTMDTELNAFLSSNSQQETDYLIEMCRLRFERARFQITRLDKILNFDAPILVSENVLTEAGVGVIKAAIAYILRTSKDPIGAIQTIMNTGLLEFNINYLKSISNINSAPFSKHHLMTAVNTILHQADFLYQQECSWWKLHFRPSNNWYFSKRYQDSESVRAAQTPTVEQIINFANEISLLTAR